jgi:PAS domain S-box-containing protein
MARDLHGWWRRVTRDPYTLLLAAAAAVQVTLGSSSASLVVRPGWEVAAIVMFVIACVCAAIGRIRGIVALQVAAPFVLLVVAGCWRAADREAVNGFGALTLISVIWLGFYGTRKQVWLSIAGVTVAMIVPPLLIGDGLTGNDIRRAALTIAIAMFIGPTLNALVTQRQRETARAAALEPAGSRLDAVLRAASGHLIIGCDPRGTVTAFNPGAERILGWSAAEVVDTMTMLDFHDPDATPILAAKLGVEPTVAAMLGTTLLSDVMVRDYPCRTKDGRSIVVSLSISAIRDSSGELSGFVGIGNDVTEARKALQSLAAQREIYRLLVDHLPLTTVGLWDEHLRCVTIGGHWLNKTGAESTGFVGRPIEDFFLEPDRAEGRAVYERARFEYVDAEMDLSDGRSYDFAALPVDGPDGQPLVLSLARDITDRRRAELERQDMLAALAVSEASFREAFEGAPIGIALTTVQAPVERFLRVNPAFAAILGRDPDDLVDIPVADVTHPEDVHLQPDLTKSASAPTTKLRKRFMRPSGRAVWVEVSYTVVLDSAGVPSHVIKQIQDINTIKESERALLDALEQQRAATASLREVDRIRTDLVGTISHELRTPLTSVHGYLELLDSEPLTEAQHGMLDVALRNSERLSNLVDNLLVLVRLDSAETLNTFSSADIAMSNVVAAAVDTVRPEMTERRQELSVNLPPNPAIVRGDGEQLDRVLVNLLSNASKYTPAGGQVSIDVDLHGDTLSITVGDTGIGIPLEEQEQLFTRFFRASTARAHSISGNGLGLAIVKSIVERHAGTVSVASSPGAGSQFTVTLPLVRQTATVIG